MHRLITKSYDAYAREKNSVLIGRLNVTGTVVLIMTEQIVPSNKPYNACNVGVLIHWRAEAQLPSS